MRTYRYAAALASVALFAASCGGGAEGDDNTGGDALSGKIAIDGSSTVGPLTEAVQEEYNAVQPDVSVELAISGTGGGFERFCGVGDTDISNASRPIKQEEADLCADNGIDFVEVRVGTDALTMVTSPETGFLTCLTTEQIIALYGPDGATTWDEIDPSFPNEKIAIFAPGTDSGTYDFMLETIDIESARQDIVNASEDDNIIVQGVQGTPNSWGYFGFAYYQENQNAVSVVEYDAGDGCVAPSVDTTQDDSYKLSRPLFIYVKKQSLTEKAHVADFVRFYLDNVGELIESVGYVPAPQEDIDAAATAVEDALAG